MSFNTLCRLPAILPLPARIHRTSCQPRRETLKHLLLSEFPKVANSIPQEGIDPKRSGASYLPPVRSSSR